MNQSIRNSIAHILSIDKRPIPSGILMEKVRDNLKITNKHLIYKVIDEMIHHRELIKLDDGKLREGYINTEIINEPYIGIIAINSMLDGYVKLYDQDNNLIDKEAYVNNVNLNGAISGDLVEIKFMKDKFTKQGIQHAVVSKIIDHNTKFAIGTFELTGKEYHVKLDDPRNYLKIVLDNTEYLVNGSKILIELNEFKNDICYAKVHKIIGHINDVGIDVLSIILSHEIEQDFSPEALTIANNLKFNDNDKDNIRRDLSERLIVTIDPATSKDLDDAIHVEKLSNDEYFLSVCIADVSNYLGFDTPLWNEAMNRSTSVYLVDRVIPMLPHNLSNNICSLNPNEPRLCLTCDLIIDKEGNYKKIDVYPSKINSYQRLSYDEVNAFFNNEKTFNDQKLESMLNAAKELHYILRKRKQQEGYIDFEIKEPKIIVNEKCWPIDIQIKNRGIAQKMIEDFMVAANEGVTINAEALKIPFIYRVHKRPDIIKLENFAIEAKKLGFITNQTDFENMEPSTIAKWLKQNENNSNINLISKLLLRCMQKAEYNTNNYGHFGLSSKYYTHFTSPIRRSSDSIVHMLYWMFVFNKDKYDEHTKEKFKNKLDEYCKHATEKEIIATNTEREVNQLKFCQYMSDHLNEEFDGTISMVKAFGIFIELENTVEVLVKINHIGKDFWKYNSENNTIEGLKSHKVFSFGQKIRIKISGVNIDSKQINAIIVGYEPEILKNHKRENNRNLDKKRFY